MITEEQLEEIDETMGILESFQEATDIISYETRPIFNMLLPIIKELIEKCEEDNELLKNEILNRLDLGDIRMHYASFLDPRMIEFIYYNERFINDVKNDYFKWRAENNTNEIDELNNNKLFSKFYSNKL